MNKKEAFEIAYKEYIRVCKDRDLAYFPSRDVAVWERGRPSCLTKEEELENE